MTHVLMSLRRRPGPLVGTLVALTMSAVLLTTIACLLGTGLSLNAPVARLAGATVVVTGDQDVRVTSGHGPGAQTDTLPLPSYRRVPVALAARLATLPGVEEAVADVSFPVALQVPGGSAKAGESVTGSLTGHGWQSAALTPFVLSSGHTPEDADQVVVGAGVAAAFHLGVGEQVRLAGADVAPFQIVGVAPGSGGNPADASALFFAPAEAAALYGHAGQADLIGVIADPGVRPSALAARVRASLPKDFSVLSGADRGKAENLAAATDARNLQQFVEQIGLDLVLIALFVAASTVALSVAQRRRSFSLLRAVGATSAQIKRMMLLELGLLGLFAGVVSYLPGTWVTSWVLRGMATHHFVPASTRAWSEPWIALVVSGITVVVAELAGYAAARRASRVSPAAALREADVERRWPHPVRVTLGVLFLCGGGTLYWFLGTNQFSAYERTSLSLELGLLLMAALALLGPLLVAGAEVLLRLPVRLISRVGGRWALTELRVRPRRVTAAVVSVALAVAFVGVVGTIEATENHLSIVQGREQLLADDVVTAPGPGLSTSALAAIGTEPGIADAIGVTSTDVFVPAPGSDLTDGEVVTAGPLDSVLNLRVVAGTLRGFGPGDIALSRLQAGKGAVGAHVGERITAYLADGTPYRATVTAIYLRSFGFGDVIIPADAGATTSSTESVGEVLVRTARGVAPEALTDELRPLETRFPGLLVAPRTVVNAEEATQDAQGDYANNLLLGALVLLSGVALVNTLVMAVGERRESLRLLRRLGATGAQALSMTAWQAVLLGALGLALGAAVGVPSLIVVTKAISGSWMPYLTWPPALATVAVVMAVVGVSTIGPTGGLLVFDRDR